MVTLEELVPKDSLLRLIDRYIRIDFIRERTAHLYCADNGRPALDPVTLFKMLFIGYLFGIRPKRHLKASANKNRYDLHPVRQKPAEYLAELNAAIDADRAEHGKKPLPPGDEEPPTKGVKVSPVGPDAGCMARDGKPTRFFYLGHRTVDGVHAIITDTHVTPANAQCTSSRNGVKIVARHVWQHYKEAVDANRLSAKGRELYKRRKETVERSFADAKEFHGHRYARFRGLAKIRAQALLAAACQNMEKTVRLLEQALRSFFAPFMRLRTAPQALKPRDTPLGEKLTIAPTSQRPLV